ncbi:hypothetical protein AALO_G00297540 [Alosa alosa]|uniref:Uncharacterized protein n=1 Tax=Alosa alosa TaxID=278164 RepID=A0AAV6FKH5_9TELE|nr:mucin-7-like [Alosa alosa]KAG5260876.1 hypothetical protein AALO_G00297540 [Alosa alosa]
MNSNLKQWKPGVLQSTHRADYKPFTEASLQLYQFRCQPQKKLNPPFYATPPPKIDKDTWTKYRKYCYRTTNSVYGSSSFTQRGKSLVVSVLDKEREEPKGNQAAISAANAKPSATPPRAGCQDTTVPPAEGSKLTAWASPPATSASQTSSSSSSGPPTGLSSASSPSASTLTTTPTPPPPAQQSHSCATPATACPTSSHIKEAWRSDTAPAKEAAPVAKETAKATDKLPQIGSGEGGAAQLQEQTERPKTIAYEDFLSDMCHSVRLESLLNQRFASQTATILKGSQPNYTTSYRESFHNLQQDKKPKVKLPKPETKQRHQYLVSEYADKFGLLQRAFPPRMSLNIAPVKVPRPQVAIQRTAPLPQRFLCSEYMASFRHPITMARPKTC